MKNPCLAALNEQRLAPNSYFRYYHIAWCLARGRTMAQIESKNSNPHYFPEINGLLLTAMSGYRPIAEGQDKAEYEAAKTAWRERLREDLTAWKRQLSINWITVEATRRQRNAAKRATPRIHPRARPATLPHEVV